MKILMPRGSFIFCGEFFKVYKTSSKYDIYIVYITILSMLVRHKIYF